MRSAAFLLLLLVACHNKSESKEALDETLPGVISPLPLTALQAAIKSAIIKIETQNIELSRNTITANSLEIDGIETVRTSMKDFLVSERNAQKTDFDNYMKYLERLKDSNSPLNDPNKKLESQAKHRAVINYLDHQIKKASSEQNIYKVVYYLKADTRDVKYDQTQTLYLDEQFKKVDVDYSHLTPSF